MNRYNRARGKEMGNVAKDDVAKDDIAKDDVAKVDDTEVGGEGEKGRMSG